MTSTSYALLSLDENGFYLNSLINGTADDICSYLNCGCTTSTMSMVPIFLGIGLLLLLSSSSKKKRTI